MTKLILLAVLAAVGWWMIRKVMAVKPVRPVMPRDEAAHFLGVASDVDTATVNEAHRRLIAKVHPDVGGNAELAAPINMARDTMLKL